MTIPDQSSQQNHTQSSLQNSDQSSSQNPAQSSPESYTTYRDKIGLGTTPQTFLSENQEVVLNWPYKDAVLEGKQAKETIKQDNEKFYHETASAAEIEQLLAPKVFTDWQRHDVKGMHIPQRLREKDSYLVRGNNLVTLYSLRPRFARKVRLIYIDVPFNTGRDTFTYNDRFRHSTWLTFMKNRLEVAHDFLTPDGSIFIHADWHEVHYLKVLCDEIFGRENFINEIIWCYTGPSSPQMNQLNRKHDTILWYANDATNYVFNKDGVRVPYRSPYQSMRKGMDAAGAGWSDEDVSRLRERGRVPDDWWSDIPVAARMPIDGRRRTGYLTEKPVKLLERIIRMASDPDDLIMDFFAGSGTTLYVAAQLGRRFIGVEQLSTGYRLTEQRLTDTNYLSCTLRDDAEAFCRRVRIAPAADLPKLLGELKTARFLDERVDPDKLNPDDFQKLDPDMQKQLLHDCVNKESLYVNYTDIDNPEYAVSDVDKRLNHMFYS